MKYCPAAPLMFSSDCKKTRLFATDPDKRRISRLLIAGIINCVVKVIVPIDRDRVVQPYSKASPATCFLLPFVCSCRLFIHSLSSRSCCVLLSVERWAFNFGSIPSNVNVQRYSQLNTCPVHDILSR